MSLAIRLVLDTQAPHRGSANPPTGITPTPAQLIVPGGTAGGSLLATLVEIGGTGQNVVFSVSGNSNLTITGNQLKAAASPTFTPGVNQTYTLSVTDSGGTFTDPSPRTLQVPAAPTAINFTGTSVPSNIAANAPVGTLSTVGGTAPYTYTCSNSKFQISGSQVQRSASGTLTAGTPETMNFTSTDASTLSTNTATNGQGPFNLQVTVPGTFSSLINVNNLSVAASFVTPVVSYGLSFKDGDVPSGGSIVINDSNGSPVTVQQSQEKSFASGCLSHAVIHHNCAETFGASAQKTYTLKSSSSAPNRTWNGAWNASGTPEATLAANSNFIVEFSGLDCGSSIYQASVNYIIANYLQGPGWGTTSPKGGWERLSTGPNCMQWRFWEYIRNTGSGLTQGYIRCDIYVTAWAPAGPYEVHIRVWSPNTWNAIASNSEQYNQPLKRFAALATLKNGSTVVYYFGGPSDLRARTVANSNFNTSSYQITSTFLQWKDLYGAAVMFQSTGSLPAGLSPSQLYFPCNPAGYATYSANYNLAIHKYGASRVEGASVTNNWQPNTQYNSQRPTQIIMANNQYYLNTGGYAGIDCTANGTNTVTCFPGNTTTGMMVGQALSGGFVPTNATVTGVIDSTHFTMSAAATGSGFTHITFVGVSASSGSGPSGNNIGIPDGSTFWDYCTVKFTDQGSGTITLFPVMVVYPMTGWVGGDIHGDPIWIGAGARPWMAVGQDLAYMITTTAVQPFGLDCPNVPCADPIEAYNPMGVGPGTYGISNTGDSPGDQRISFINQQACETFFDNSDPVYYCNSLAEGLQWLAFPCHSVDERSGYPLCINNGPAKTGTSYPNMASPIPSWDIATARGYWNGSGSPGNSWAPQSQVFANLAGYTSQGVQGGQNSPSSIWAAHMPALWYGPYLKRGYRVLLDIGQTHAIWMTGGAVGPGFGSNVTYAGTTYYCQVNIPGRQDFQQLRGYAWSLRCMNNARWITPDADPMRAYLTDISKDNVDSYLYYLANIANANVNVLGYIPAGEHNSFRYNSGAGAGVAPWQQAWLSEVLGMEAWRGWYSPWSTYASRMVTWYTTVYTGNYLYQLGNYDLACASASDQYGGNLYVNVYTTAAAIESATLIGKGDAFTGSGHYPTSTPSQPYLFSWLQDSDFCIPSVPNYPGLTNDPIIMARAGMKTLAAAFPGNATLASMITNITSIIKARTGVTTGGGVTWSQNGSNFRRDAVY